MYSILSEQNIIHNSTGVTAITEGSDTPNQPVSNKNMKPKHVLYSTLFWGKPTDVLWFINTFSDTETRVMLNEIFPKDARVIKRLPSKQHHEKVQWRLLLSKLRRIDRRCENPVYVNFYNHLLNTTLFENINFRNVVFAVASETINLLQNRLEDENREQRIWYQPNKIPYLEEILQISIQIREKAMLKGVNKPILTNPIDFENVDDITINNFVSSYITPRPPSKKSIYDFGNITDEAKVAISELLKKRTVIAAIEDLDVYPNSYGLPTAELYIVTLLDGVYYSSTYRKYGKCYYNQDLEIFGREGFLLFDAFGSLSPRISKFCSEVFDQDEGLEEYAITRLLLGCGTYLEYILQVR